MHVRRFLAVVEEQHFSSFQVDFRVRGDALRRDPLRRTQIIERIGIEQITFATHVKRRHDFAGMNNDVRGGGVFHPPARAPAFKFSFGRIGCDSRPQGSSGFLFSEEALRAYKAVAVARLAVLEGNRVNHAVAVERVVNTDRVVQRIFGIANVYAAQVFRDFANNFHLVRGDFPRRGRPRAVEIGMLVRRNLRFEFIHNRD